MVRTGICLFVLVLCSCGTKMVSAQGSKSDKKRWMAQNVVPVVDSGKSSFSFLKEAVGDKRIVFLGEANHIDGTVSAHKLAAIRYLHEEMGFEVLVDELPFVLSTYLTDKVDNERQMGWFMTRMIGTDNLTVDGFLPLSRYLWNSWQSGDSLLYHGMDLYLIHQNKLFVRFMKPLFEESYPEIARRSCFSRAIAYLQDWDKESRKAGFPSFDRDVGELIDLLLADGGDGHANGLTALKWKNALSYIRHELDYNCSFSRKSKNYEDTGARNFDCIHERDKQMAENLLWLMEKKYPGKKFIVSASSYHTGRNFDAVRSQNPYFDTGVPMGRYLWEKYPDDIYSIAFLSNGGILGDTGQHYDNLKEKVRRRHITSVSKNFKYTYRQKRRKGESIEGLIRGTGHKTAFLDLTLSETEGGAWLREPHDMQPTFHRPFKIDWTQCYDGVFYIDEGRPQYWRHIYELYPDVPRKEIYDYMNQF